MDWRDLAGRTDSDGLFTGFERVPGQDDGPYIPRAVRPCVVRIRRCIGRHPNITGVVAEVDGLAVLSAAVEVLPI